MDKSLELAINYAHKALASGYVDISDLLGINDRMVKAICGKRASQNEMESIEALCKHFQAQLKPHPTPVLDHNSRLLATGLGLPESGWLVIKLLSTLNTNDALNKFIANILPIDEHANAMFADMLDMNEVSLNCILNALARTGLFNSHTCTELIDFVRFPDALAHIMVTNKADSYVDLISVFIQPATASELTLADFDYLETDTLFQFLDLAINESMAGVNILLYGSPGTGKTQLSKALADTAYANLTAIKPIGNEIERPHRKFDDRAFSSNLRMQYLALVQQLLPPDEKNLLLLDECEDVFEQSISHRGYGKDMLHGLLEENAIPTIWVTNHIQSIPNSCIRRFSYVINVEAPDNRVLEAVMGSHFKGLRVSSEFKKRLASTPNLVPAHITNAALVSHCVELKGKSAEHNINTMVTATLNACGHDTHTTQYKPQMRFSTDYLNIKGGNQAVSQLSRAVKQHSDIRTLLLGPSGTGKTALVDYLGETNNQEIITVRCSDVISKFVGESEQNIARLFQQASSSNSILFFDEIDSLLMDRRGTTNSWEVQQVNELLTQMECFNQPFFAATNFAERLDSAVMRRFDFKLSFDYLTQKQALCLFCDVTGYKSTAKLQQALRSLTLLTTGDFAILKRRQTINTVKLTWQECLDILTAEHQRKQPANTIGFL